jgi:hypothetical protein
MSRFSEKTGISTSDATNLQTGGLSGGLSSGTATDILNTLTGKSAADAATRAAELQLQGTREGIAEIKEGRLQSREDLSPFREFGAGQLEGITSLISDPNAQRDFIQNNPFFDTLADQASSRLFANKAARGKIGSGGTAESLQTSLLGLGNQLLNQNITQRMNAATLGSNAAAGQATVTQNASSGISDLITQGANAQAAGQVGAANARTNALNQLIQGGAIAISDRRLKHNVVFAGMALGLPVYWFSYLGETIRNFGHMAQDVLKVKPEAVITLPNGFYAVHYGRLYAH